MCNIIIITRDNKYISDRDCTDAPLSSYIEIETHMYFIDMPEHILMKLIEIMQSDILTFGLTVGYMTIALKYQGIVCPDIENQLNHVLSYPG